MIPVHSDFFEVRPTGLKILSPYISMHIKNIKTELVCILGNNFGVACSSSPSGVEIELGLDSCMM